MKRRCLWSPEASTFRTCLLPNSLICALIKLSETVATSKNNQEAPRGWGKLSRLTAAVSIISSRGRKAFAKLQTRRAPIRAAPQRRRAVREDRRTHASRDRPTKGVDDKRVPHLQDPRQPVTGRRVLPFKTGKGTKWQPLAENFLYRLPFKYDNKRVVCRPKVRGTPPRTHLERRLNGLPLF